LSLSFFMVVSTSFAAEPWTWRVTLDGTGSGQVVDMPTSLYIDVERQRYYVVDSGGNRLLSFERDGNFLLAFYAEGKLESPFDMVRDEKDVIWVVERGKNTLTSIDVRSKQIVPHTLKDGTLTLVPDRIDYKDGVFYILDKQTGRIVILNRDLQVKKWLLCPDCSTGIVDFKLSEEGLWALTQLDKKVVRFDAEGKIVGSFTVEEHVDFPVSLAIGPAGNIYILDRHAADIAVFDAQGRFKYTFLAKGLLRGELYYPIEISFDPWGGLCVVEEGSGRVEVFGR